MSAAPVRQQRAHAPRPEAAPRRHLRAVAAPETARSLVPFAIACVGVVLAALAAVLLINTTMAEGAYERRDLKIQIRDLHVQQAALQETLDTNASPEELARRASVLGMAPASALGFVSLSDGIVLETGKK
ncbi:hypothetical protein QQX09_09985 [Demequina sp. SYSU T00192]|uniref:Cell division protein FtsL n=1 Tax=Demequina litoralis TaxID=3051660 RepID=A0ABT8GB38_9MICO|nr:hypothetical protein [Demequina sp. SYSU T00192]MDN4476182.1 hypothetical protein [Demequina sp. SYSU T00192]